MDKVTEIFRKHSNEISREIDEIYKIALIRRFGKVDAETIGMCDVYVQDGVKILRHGDEILCEILPPTIESTEKLRPYNTSTYEPENFKSTLKYRIFV